MHLFDETRDALMGHVKTGYTRISTYNREAFRPDRRPVINKSIRPCTFAGAQIEEGW